eukprot:1147202-Pelagomonas_calceolata.AAC.1
MCLRPCTVPPGRRRPGSSNSSSSHRAPRQSAMDGKNALCCSSDSSCGAQKRIAVCTGGLSYCSTNPQGQSFN